jgi:hypothetical protein
MQFTTYSGVSLDLAYFYKRISNVKHASINITDGNCSELLRRSNSPLPRKKGERRDPTPNESAGNITLYRGQQGDRELRVKRACSKL